MRIAHEMTAIVAAAAIASGIHWMAEGRPSGIPAEELARTPLREGEVEWSTLRAEGLDGVLFIDARRAEEWQRDGLKDSINITPLSDLDLVEQLAPHIDALASARRIVVYCGDLHCGLSHELAERLKAEFSELMAGEPSVLHGGMTALKEAGVVPQPGS